MKRINYASHDVPENYTCSKCGAHGVKLWRPYQTMCPELLCAECAAESDEDQDRLLTMGPDGRTDYCLHGHYIRASLEIGGNVPAIPDEEGIGYWGYNSFSEASILWWDSLPNSPDEPAGISHLKEKVAEDTTLEHFILWRIASDVWAIEERPRDYPSTWSFYGEKEAKKRWDILVDRAKRLVAGVEKFNNRERKR